jgi:2-hydroxychromene-2-carboxylate isomerase
VTGNAIEFWFSIGSTYTYLTVMRIDDIAKREQTDVCWRPFPVGNLMDEQNNIPFRGKPVKTAYMWRDIERRAAMYGFPARVPAPYELAEYHLVNKIAVLADREGWCRDYVKESYRRWFEDGEEISQAPYVQQALQRIGQDPTRVLAAARRAANEQAYRQITDEARRLGVFGSPSFVVAGEVFWGDDRLEDAIRWAQHGSLAGAAPSSTPNRTS